MEITRDRVLEQIDRMITQIDRMLVTLLQFKEVYEKAGYLKHAEFFESIALLLFQVQEFMKEVHNWL